MIIKELIKEAENNCQRSCIAIFFFYRDAGNRVFEIIEKLQLKEDNVQPYNNELN